MGLRIRVGESSAPAIAFGLPRPDRHRETGEPGAYRSGFWAIAAVTARRGPETVEVVAEGTLADNRRASARLGSIELREAPDGWRPSGGAVGGPRSAGGDRIAICMATFEPDLDLLAAQIESIRAQTHADWTCVISDDASSQRAQEGIRALVGDDARFRVLSNERRLGQYGNFERALLAAPADAAVIAFSDQDDRWHPDKLATLADALDGAALAYSDARIVDRNGTVLSPTYWSRRPNNWTDLASLALANTVSGNAAQFRRELLDLALPFPPAHAQFFHDHWVALCALATGKMAYVDRPLYDYVQHEQAALGHERAQVWAARRARLPVRLRRFRDDPGYFYDHWRNTYFTEYCRVAVMAQTLLLRAGERLDDRDRRTLERLVRADRSPSALAWLAGRRLRRVLGTDETLKAEARLLRAFTWRHALERIPARPDHPRALVPRSARWDPNAR
jgi:glycosyltransferase involved in cell wall biosynthesis